MYPRTTSEIVALQSSLFVCLFVCLFVLVEALCTSQQSFSHVGTFSWIEPVLSYEDEVSCSMTQHPAILLTSVRHSTT